ncbi:hypothetical protein ACO0M4_08420 [Streptomyces sp. RGM 3693]|uniref:hypothetical protein n=1 Tax=Streptomyces sp. RGM 3693 TaxID=3413284 RepID=UPI003D2A38D4
MVRHRFPVRLTTDAHAPHGADAYTRTPPSRPESEKGADGARRVARSPTHRADRPCAAAPFHRHVRRRERTPNRRPDSPDDSLGRQDPRDRRPRMDAARQPLIRAHDFRAGPYA